jgi:hypothetical protein
MIDDIKDKDIVTIVAASAAALLEYFIEHPATAITTVIMLLITWERYKSRRFEARLLKSKSEREDFELETAKLKHDDWIKRAKIQDEEDKKIKEDEKH